jgi:hypothetical protein
MDTNVEDTLTGIMSGKAPSEANSGRVSKSSAIGAKLPTGIDGLVLHMVEGAQRVADVDEPLEAALKSFQTIEQWYVATSVYVQPSLAKLYSSLFHLQF